MLVTLIDTIHSEPKDDLPTMLRHRESTRNSKAFSVQVNRSQSSGPLVAHFDCGKRPPVILGLSPTSSSINSSRLMTIINWLLPRCEQIYILTGWWFHRWNLMVFDKLSSDQASKRVSKEMARLQSRIEKSLGELCATGRVNIIQWPETHFQQDLIDIRRDLTDSANKSPLLSEALFGAVRDFLDGLSGTEKHTLSHDDNAKLFNYVVEEVSTLVYLSLRVSPLEVYPGSDLPVMRRLAAGEFLDTFAYDLSQRSHLALELIPLDIGELRNSLPSDWEEIERLIRAWPTHFVEKAVELAYQDFHRHHAIVCDGGDGRLLGFVIWNTDGRELELIWMAVDPLYTRRGIGSGIVRAVLCHRTTENRVFLRTASTDAVIPGTSFDSSAYRGTNKFFSHLGFIEAGRITDFWGSGDHCLIMEKVIL